MAKEKVTKTVKKAVEKVMVTGCNACGKLKPRLQTKVGVFCSPTCENK